MRSGPPNRSREQALVGRAAPQGSTSRQDRLEALLRDLGSHLDVATSREQEAPPLCPTGLREVDASGLRVLRGGSLYYDAEGQWVWGRYRMKPDTEFPDQGLRPARKVTASRERP